MQRRSKEWRGEAGSEDWSWMRSFITAVRWSCCVFREWRNGTGCVHHGVMMHNGASCCSLRRQGGTGERALLFHAWRRAMCTMARDQRARDLGIRLDLQSPRCGEYGSCKAALVPRRARRGCPRVVFLVGGAQRATRAIAIGKRRDAMLSCDSVSEDAAARAL